MNSLCYLQTRFCTPPVNPLQESDALLAIHIWACYSQLNLCLACLIAYLNARDSFRVHEIYDTAVAAWEGCLHVSCAHWRRSYVHLPLLRHSGVTNAFASCIMCVYVMYIYIGGSFFRTMTANTWPGLEKENIQNSIESMYFAFLTTIHRPFAFLFFLFAPIPKPSTWFQFPFPFSPHFLVFRIVHLCACVRACVGLRYKVNCKAW